MHFKITNKPLHMSSSLSRLLTPQISSHTWSWRQWFSFPSAREPGGQKLSSPDSFLSLSLFCNFDNYKYHNHEAVAVFRGVWRMCLAGELILISKWLEGITYTHKLISGLGKHLCSGLQLQLAGICKISWCSKEVTYFNVTAHPASYIKETYDAFQSSIYC